MWDIQSNPIGSYGKKVVDLKFVSDAGDVDAEVVVDIADVKKNVAGMGRLCRAGTDMHFTNFGHTCWMERQGQMTAIQEDDPLSDAPLFNLQVEVKPTPTTRMEVNDEKTVLAAPLDRVDQIKIGDEVRLIGLDRCAELNDKIARSLGTRRRVAGGPSH